MANEIPDSTTRCTVRNYTLNIELYDHGARAVWVDPWRNYMRVAEASVPKPMRDNLRQRDLYFRKISRAVLDNYREQYRFPDGVLKWLPGIELTSEDRRGGVGKTTERHEPPPKPERASLARHKKTRR